MLTAGRYDDVLRSRAIWACTGCYACTVECPKQLPVTESIYALKRASMRAGAYPRRFITPVLARQFVRLINKRGRSSEAWISLALYLRTRPFQLLRYAPVALRLMRRGRLPLRPRVGARTGPATEGPRCPRCDDWGGRMSYAYYPGCSAKGTGRAYEESLRAVFGALGDRPG